MATTKCINANAQKLSGDAATIAAAGNVSGKNSNKSLISLNVGSEQYGSSVKLAVSANSSGNLGTIKPYGAGVFQSLEKGQYIMMVAGTKISQVATNQFRGGANWMRQRPFNKIQVTHTGFLTALTWSSNRDGQPTYTLTQSAQAPDFGVDKETTTLGQLAYRTGKPIPVQGDYSTPTSQ